MTFDLLSAARHDLTPAHELTVTLPQGACVYADRGYNSTPDEASILLETGERLIPIRKTNMLPHAWADEFALRQ